MRFLFLFNGEKLIKLIIELSIASLTNKKSENLSLSKDRESKPNPHDEKLWKKKNSKKNFFLKLQNGVYCFNNIEHCKISLIKEFIG